jgi:hypothetical protein
MKAYVVAGLLTVGFAMPAFAAEKYFMTVDTVGNCSVIQGKPTSGQTAFGETAGYDSAEAADKALAEARKDTEKCKGVVE